MLLWLMTFIVRLRNVNYESNDSENFEKLIENEIDNEETYFLTMQQSKQ